tara:strand:- start:321 stop:497 length:177 start_codon:yes stop_codon:yes gene_type:complete
MNIKEAQYYTNGQNQVCGVKITMQEGNEVFAPRSEGNRFYAEILRQVKEGTLKIKDAD